MKILLCTLVALLLPLSTSTYAQEEAEDDSTAATIERIVELQRQIDELMSTLTADERETLRTRLAESAAPGADDTSAASAEATGADRAPAVAAATATAVTADSAETVTAEAATSTDDAGESSAAADVARATPAEAAPAAPQRRRRSRPHCNFLTPLDSNDDGKISALDRHWRHLYIWTDGNGDGAAQDDEVKSAYDFDIREIAIDLDTFTRKKGTIGEARVERYLELDVRSDGFSSGRPVLVVDATKVKRSDGPELFSAAGEPLEGYQPFQSGGRIDVGDESTALSCP